MNAMLSNVARRTGSLLVAAVIVAALSATADACPSCKAALAAQEGQGDLVSGFFWSILFMMSMPFALVTSFSGYMYLLVRRSRGAANATSVDPADAAGGEAIDD